MVQTLTLGSLYLDGKSIASEAKYQPGQSISFGAGISDQIINWVPVNGLLIADRCLLSNTSWDDLNAQGLVFGNEIKVQGFRFKTRLLKVGSKEGISNEWDAALDIVGEDDTLWHWNGKYFWGQESTSLHGFASGRATRGCYSARRWRWDTSSGRNSGVGFRPTLEPLPTDPSALRHGQEVMVIGMDGCVVGCLMDKTKYDLILQPKPGGLVGEAAFAAIMRDGTVAVDQNRILSIVVAYR